MRVGPDEPVRHVGGDETGCSGDENVLGRVRSHLDNNKNKETNSHALLQYKNETLDPDLTKKHQKLYRVYDGLDLTTVRDNYIK